METAATTSPSFAMLVPMHHFVTCIDGKRVTVTHLLVDIDNILICGRIRRPWQRIQKIVSDITFNSLPGVQAFHLARIEAARMKLASLLTGNPYDI